MIHFTEKQRYKLEILLEQNINKTTIAIELGVHISSIYREIKRNSDGRNFIYKSDLAQRKCQKRHALKSKNQCFTAQIKRHIEALIKEDFSPEQIVGKSKRDNITCVSHETIYKYIWKDKKDKGDLYVHLRHKGKIYRKRGAFKDKRGQIVGRNGIENRPEEVKTRHRIGDLEIDLVMGKDNKGALLTINDPSNGMLEMTKVESKDAEVVKNAVIDLLQGWKYFLKTITSDNGKEFSKHQEIAAALNIDYYFANPYCSWERGANENLNGLVRQYFPKGSDFSLISKEQVANTIEKLNNRPRKRYEFKSPKEVYLQQLKTNQAFAFIN